MFHGCPLFKGTSEAEGFLELKYIRNPSPFGDFPYKGKIREFGNLNVKYDLN
jgi:hypothetical protein